jgi:hypothetical protein
MKDITRAQNVAIVWIVRRLAIVCYFEQPSERHAVHILMMKQWVRATEPTKNATSKHCTVGFDENFLLRWCPTGKVYKPGKLAIGVVHGRQPHEGTNTLDDIGTVDHAADFGGPATWLAWLAAAPAAVPARAAAGFSVSATVIGADFLDLTRPLAKSRPLLSNANNPSHMARPHL